MAKPKLSSDSLISSSPPPLGIIFGCSGYGYEQVYLFSFHLGFCVHCSYSSFCFFSQLCFCSVELGSLILLSISLIMALMQTLLSLHLVFLKYGLMSLYCFQEKHENVALMTNDDVLGDKIPDGQEYQLRRFCYEMLKLPPGVCTVSLPLLPPKKEKK